MNVDSRKKEKAGPQTRGSERKDAQKPVERPGVRFSIRLKFTLAIISLVVLIIISMTLFFILRESNILKMQIMSAVERETVHLANTAQQSIGVDELSLIAAINDLKKIDYIMYAFVLDKDDAVVQHFDRRGERAIAGPLNDNTDRKLSSRSQNTEILILNLNDPKNIGGRIYDFSKTIQNKVDKRKIGTVIIGISDVVIRNEMENLIKIIVPIAFGFLLIAIVASVVMAGITIRPVKALSKGAEIIGKGDLDYRIDIKSRDELGQLAREFNQMTAQIKEAKQKEIETSIMEEQIETAKEIQEGLNPTRFYQKDGIQIKGYTRAQRGVGGDYFDYIDIDDEKVGALISDVAGKGVAASLVMVMIRTVFTSYISREVVDCASVVRTINESFGADFAADKFATLFFMIYDRGTEELSFSNAGHGPLFCYRAAMNSCTITKLDGVPIGIDEDSVYKQARVKLNPGDMVVLYTDGVTEMRNEQGEEYGIQRLNKLVVANNHLNAEEFVQLMVEDLEKFRGQEPPHDDTTMLVLKRIS